MSTFLSRDLKECIVRILIDERSSQAEACRRLLVSKSTVSRTSQAYCHAPGSVGR